jgi:hypothetical protein
MLYGSVLNSSNIQEHMSNELVYPGVRRKVTHLQANTVISQQIIQHMNLPRHPQIHPLTLMLCGLHCHVSAAQPTDAQ